MENLLSDLRHAARVLTASPGLVFVSVLSLGLGLGANLALFAFLRATLFYQPDVADPERVVGVQPGNSNQFSYLNFCDLEESGIFQSRRQSFARKEPAPPFIKFGRPEDITWSELIPVSAFEKAGFHYITKAIAVRRPLNLGGAETTDTMVMYLHPDRGHPDKQTFLNMRNKIVEAWKPAWDAAQEGKYGSFFERRIEGRLERVS